VTGSPADAAGLASRVPIIRRVAPAAVIEENTVDVVRGQALSLGARGMVSVVSNRLVSRGLVAVDLRAFGAGGAQNVLARLSSLVAIVNLGSPGGGAVNMGAATTGASLSAASGFRADLKGKVLFDDNQCLLDLLHGPRSPGAAPPGNTLLPAILILSLDDIGFGDNQCDCLIEEGQMPVANVLLGLLSVRTAANRFSETLGKAQFSALTFALMNMTVNNQANHCLKVVGPLRLQAQPNHVLISISLKEYCPAAERTLIALMTANS
jgi:hypothetical protein